VPRDPSHLDRAPLDQVAELASLTICGEMGTVLRRERRKVPTVRMPRTSRSVAVLLGACALVAVTGASSPASAAEPVPPGSARPAEPAPRPPASPSKCATTTSEKLGWGEPTRTSDFDGATLPSDWHAYGPEPGHAKKGTRTPDAVTLEDGVVTITGQKDGATGAISWHPGQRYGRWEGCVKADPGKGGYNALFLLWPVAEDFPVGGEIDWMEITSDDRQKTSFFLHYGAQNDQEYGSVRHDATEWNAWAVEWTPEEITAYVNGKEWYSTTETSHFPPGPMNMTMQLDYFPPAGGSTAMHMDWAKQWALPESEPAELSLGPGEPATGQPRDYPQHKPRPLDQIGQ
jgi:hypothetical protein